MKFDLRGPFFKLVKKILNIIWPYDNLDLHSYG